MILQQNEIGGIVSSEAGEVPGEINNSNQTDGPEHVAPLGKLIFKFLLANLQVDVIPQQSAMGDILG